MSKFTTYKTNSICFEDVEVRGTVELDIDDVLEQVLEHASPDRLLAAVTDDDILEHVVSEVAADAFVCGVSNDYLQDIVAAMDDAALVEAIEAQCGGGSIEVGHFMSQFKKETREEIYAGLREEFVDPLLPVFGLSFSPFSEHQMCTVTNGDGRTVGYIHLVGPNGTCHASYAPPEGEVMFFSSQSLDTVRTILVNVHRASQSMGKML